MLNNKDGLNGQNGKPSLKQASCAFLDKFIVAYLALNRTTTGFFAKMFDKNSKMYVLFSSDSLSLILNAAILAVIGNILGGFIGRVAFLLVLLNIIFFLVNYAKGSDNR